MRTLLTLLAAAVLFLHGAAAADDHDEALRALQSGKIVALSEILKQVEQQFTGQIVKIELIKDKTPEENFIYKVTLLTSAGDLIEVFFDARDGTPIGMGGKGLSKTTTGTNENTDRRR